MNGTTVKNLLKCGYSLGSKDFSLLTNSSRILYNHTNRHSCSSSWSTQQNHRHTFSLFAVQCGQFNVNSSLFVLDHRCFSTTPSQNGQTALKPKDAERNSNNSNNKQSKDKKKSISSDKAQVTHEKNDSETENKDEKSESLAADDEKLTTSARFKKMLKEYWYVLLPVHLVTSPFWFGGFYYLSTSGVDIPTLLESMHFSEAVISKLRDSSLGHAAVAYLCYKIVTPIRYTVTLGGTTFSIKYLERWGYIRPVPTKAELKQIYDDQKAKFQNAELKQIYDDQKAKFQKK